jgi:predicted acetyltransferase
MHQEPDGYIDPGPLIDDDLELIAPAREWINDMLLSCQHPLTRLLMPQQSQIGRNQWESFLAQCPHGYASEGAARDHVRAYHFWMRLRADAAGAPPPVPIAGGLSLRLGHDENLDLYLGHIGYHVLPPARGKHYAERSCRLILPLARSHGFDELWITTNPDNAASRRTIERLGGILVNLVDVPPSNPLYGQGDRQKYRYRLAL